MPLATKPVSMAPIMLASVLEADRVRTGTDGPGDLVRRAAAHLRRGILRATVPGVVECVWNYLAAIASVLGAVLSGGLKGEERPVRQVDPSRMSVNEPFGSGRLKCLE